MPATICKVLIALLACFLAASSEAGSPISFYSRAPLVSVKDIHDWRATGKATSVETLLDQLPSAYTSYSVLMFRSRSRHKAKDDAPRIIFFGPDARLLLAVSTNPDDPLYNVVEMIEYKPDDASFHFYVLDFANAASGVERGQGCETCHGLDLRPNWQPYSLWPGAFGSFRDQIPTFSRENAPFDSIVENYQDHPRLKYLRNFYMGSVTHTGATSYYTVANGAGANAVLNILISVHNLDRIADRLVKSERHETYRSVITAVLLGCSESPEEYLPPAARAEHTRSFADLVADTKRRMTLGNKRDYDLALELSSPPKLREDLLALLDGPEVQDATVRMVAGLRYLFEHRASKKINVADWSPSFPRTTYRFTDGFRGLQALIGHYVHKSSKNPESVLKDLGVQTVPGYVSTKDYGYSDFQITGEVSPKACADLKQKSLEAFGGG